jgi:hypothetical protein
MELEELLVAIDAEVCPCVNAYLKTQLIKDAFNLDWIEALAVDVSQRVSQVVFEMWAAILEQAAVQLGLECPVCSARRTICRRGDKSIGLDLLTGRASLPEPYLRCSTPGCEGKGLSVVHLLTGVRSGGSGLLLGLQAARDAAAHSYGQAASDMKEHPLGQDMDRNKVRRLALEIEAEAMEYSESRRCRDLKRLEEQGKPEGVPRLILEADGGKVRVGELRELAPGEDGEGEKTPVRKLDKRKRETGYRELITFDVRRPGEVLPSALDSLVPLTAAEGERERRMLTLAYRKGLGKGTEVYGLGDMGSGLAAAFDEAFFDHPGFWQADKKHTLDYIRDAAKVLQDIDTDQWKKQMWTAVFDRDNDLRDTLIGQALANRVETLPKDLERCPVHALKTYLRNNWQHMRFQEMEQKGLPIVSARAEAQVRERTKRRFSVPGAWLLENLEPKATLRAIIAEGAFSAFAEWMIAKHHRLFEAGLNERVTAAVAQNRLTSKAAAVLLDPSTTLDDLLVLRLSSSDMDQKKAA